MTTGWRITKRRYADPPQAAFDGEGSRRRGGRWSAQGSRVAYASTSLALAALEYFVNLVPADAPPDLVSVRLEVPSGVAVQVVPPQSLPPDWRVYPYPPKLQQIGQSWIDSVSSVALIVPSVVIPGETNLLINPEHADFAKLIFDPPADFAFDPRMWK